METNELIKKIRKLPVQEQMFIAEQIIKDTRIKHWQQQLRYAAEEMYEEYKTNDELIAFTEIDFDDFYEAK